MVAVERPYRKLGIGSALVSTTIKRMIQDGCDEASTARKDDLILSGSARNRNYKYWLVGVICIAWIYENQAIKTILSQRSGRLCSLFAINF